MALRGSTLFLILFHLSFVITASSLAPPASSPYAPRPATCPTESLVRGASGLSSPERSYLLTRKQKAAVNLARWLYGIDKSFVIGPNNAPTVALTTSGGGYRSMLLGAGVVKALDSRDSKTGTSGLYQSLVYHGGLSGGSWLVSSIYGNDFGRISDISTSLWEPALKSNVILANSAPPDEVDAIKQDLVAKQAAGVAPTETDVWGRLIGWQLLSGTDGGVAKTLSDVKQLEAFSEFDIPVPVITALGVDNIRGANCDVLDNATTYEFTPFEFGSWDRGVAAFTPMRYFGSQLGNNTCMKGLDNLSFILGISSSKFHEGCGSSAAAALGSLFDPILAAAHPKDGRRDTYGAFPNPFKGVASSPQVANANELYLVDGGDALQNNPIWPFLQPARAVDVLIVNDNSADTDDNWPNGTEIMRTYTRAKEVGLTRMPAIPSDNVFVDKGLNKRATIFGCGQKDKITIVYLPNTGYNGTESNRPTIQFDYNQQELQGMITNGGAMATQGGDPQWPKCLACAIIEKTQTGSSSPACTECLTKYCYRG